MRRSGRLSPILPVLLLSVTACLSTVPNRSPGSSPAPDEASFIERTEERVHALVNRHRRSIGLPSLAYDERLATIAREHSSAVASGRVAFGHGGFEERSERIGALVAFSRIAENVHWNDHPASATADVAVTGWLESVEHRANIEGDFDITGVGVAAGPRGRHYCTQIFLRSN